MSNPERSPKQQRQHELRVELLDLFRRYILEDAIDPAHGLEFTIIQAQPGMPFEPLEKVAQRGRHVLTFGIPDPVEFGFEEITMSDNDRVIKEVEDTIFIEGIREWVESDEDNDDESE